ncbi:MAG TPA: hypothetical protein VJ032_00025, partial [Thermoanaerobaculia bacterium]|nr:hypothetical protein [Thermoanaerobaculia bacterium]
MKRRIAVIALLVALPVAVPASAAEKLADNYKRGVDAVRAKNYAAGAELLQKAIAEVPAENGALRVRNEIITYV